MPVEFIYPLVTREQPVKPDGRRKQRSPIDPTITLTDGDVKHGRYVLPGLKKAVKLTVTVAKKNLSAAFVPEGGTTITGLLDNTNPEELHIEEQTSFDPPEYRTLGVINVSDIPQEGLLMGVKTEPAGAKPSQIPAFHRGYKGGVLLRAVNS